MEISVMSLSLFFLVTFHAILVQVFLNLSFPEYVSAAIPGNGTDKLALLEFKSQITEDPLGVLVSWNDSIHFCWWTGVTCGFKHQRVTSLDLQRQTLAGTISPHIGNLSFLQLLNLADNSFHGGIPPKLGHLFRLRSLNLSYNYLDGEIPVNLSRCSNLMNLFLDHNYIKGHIPPEVGSLSKLVTLYLKNNNLTGRFPASIGNLSSLQELYLSYNNLHGEVPGTMAQLRSLKLLGLSMNSLSGEFPLSLYNLSSLKLLALSFNNFTGNLRADIGFAFPNLQRLYLADNYFTGLIPVSLSNASELLQLDIPDNYFNGSIPMDFGKLQNILWLNFRNNHLGSGTIDDLKFINSLTDCSQLQFLDISDNEFGGMLPHSITNLSTQLTRLLVGGNSISGSIPKEIENLFNLNVLSMDHNFLTGNIPASVAKLSSLKRLHLEANQLTGEIPSSIGNNTQLLYLYLGNNSLGGSIPSSLGNCIYMQSLDLSRNKFNGTIPEQLIGLSSLSVVLDLSHNSLTGPLPEAVGNLTNLAALDISDNKLSGEIPSKLGNCLVLEQLYLQGNSFRGSIPALSHLENIGYLDLSSNNLSGQIPQYMVNLSSLVYLNLSFNNLEGELPEQGVFRNASAFEVLSNMKLCGGVQELHLKPCPVQAPEKPHKHISHILKLVLIIFASCLALMLLSILSLYRVKKLKTRPHSSSPFGHSFPKISYEELLNATGRFSSCNLIGSGSFGTVYKGILSPEQTIVAIKVLKLQQRGASKSFMAECQAFRNVRHRNLVKILTACSSIDFNGNDFKALVYQYMPNGSLEKWLHPEGGQIEQKSLSILQRLNIAIDVASALNYLHNQCQTPVVHCDLKPSNVLLDNDLTAHVSDFGLARLLSESSQNADLHHSSSLVIKGTIGYAAPEYGMGGQMSILGDVYSYGILLLEMFTGKRPTDELFKDNLSLHSFVKLALPNQIMEIIDQSALYKEVAGEANKRVSSWSDLRSEQIECLVSVFQIGVVCSAESPRDRLNMRRVVLDLMSIRDAFLGMGMNED
ncbi:putative receptor-like protein kinase At3g47110 [Cornus florida]|uniref:putative receptor-like protein kinase At3g47110 n=1 Tax=Cornus florida TaxID=4283 RepID=UPI00289B0647|nr:putative receptor-like protein kinase At3g47110 [Cornus florida]